MQSTYNTIFPENAIAKTHCDWIMERAKELKALVKHEPSIIAANKLRALVCIESLRDSLNELEAYINEH